MKIYITPIFLFLCLQSLIIEAQTHRIDLNNNWTFRTVGKTTWHRATVPGTVHTDLQNNHLIPDPFFGDNEKKLTWIDHTQWEYKTVFNINEKIFTLQKMELVFDGLDTYADVYLNGKLILKANNMFRAYRVDVKPLVKKWGNNLQIIFHPALDLADSIARKRLPIVLPDNARVYARKSQCQFGWDWGPNYVGCGIWRKISLEAFDKSSTATIKDKDSPANGVKLIQKTDSIGTSFYFEKDGKPVYIKGVNWIPSNIFLPSVSRARYRKSLLLAKDAHMNMIRVWGGGVYEDDYFYDLCDSLGIMVWQDFMFAGGMYPGDDDFFANVKAEVVQQVNRLKKHPCIALWCGNNEVDEAWQRWGWQNQYNIHGNDSVHIWNDYTRLFRDSLRLWVAQLDPNRSYVSTSPQWGWGDQRSYTNGDSHYWGLWWGLADWESFETKTGRFVSEYGMQSMPNYCTIKKYTDKKDRTINSPIIKAHQKANNGFEKLNHYINKYFYDTSGFYKLTLQEYTYLSQCMQYYILKNSIAIHRSMAPYNMGTMLWQLNDCWPVTSWSIIDYQLLPKAAYYGVKEAYRDDLIPSKDNIYPKNLSLKKPNITIRILGNRMELKADRFAKYVYVSLPEEDIYLSDNYFDLEPGKTKTIFLQKGQWEKNKKPQIMSLYDVAKKGKLQ